MYNEEVYNEINQKDPVPSKATFVFLAIAFFVYLFIGAFPIPLIVRDIVLMVVLVAFVLMYIKGHITEYEYVYDGNTITFNTILSGRIKTTETCNIADMVSFRQEYDPREKHQQVYCVADSRRYTAVFGDGDNPVRVVFAPSDILVDMIGDRLLAISKEDSK